MIRRIWKHVFIASICCFLLSVLSGITVFADASVVTVGGCGDGNWAIFSDGYLRFNAWNSGVLTRPKNDDGTDPWKPYSSFITRIEFNDTNVREISNGMFEGLTALESISLPNGVTKIGSSAFEDCSSLTGINIPGSVKEIGDYAFSGCSSLSGNLIIPASVEKFGGSVFVDCVSLNSVNINANITMIGGSTFRGCSALGSVAFSDSIQTIGYSAFQNCIGLQSITLPDEAKKLEGYAFAGCTGLLNISMPEGLTKLGNNVFEGCTSLAGISIPDSVREFGEYSYWGTQGSPFTGYSGTIYINRSSPAGTYAANNPGPDYVCKEHQWAADYTVDTEATCTEYGSESIHCIYEDGIKEDTIRPIPIADHSYGSWTVTQEATCTVNGSREKVCSACGDTVVEEIPAAGHSFAYTLTDPQTITVACEAENCLYHSNGFSITLTVPSDAVYDGDAKEAFISGYPSVPIEGLAPEPEISYYISGGTPIPSAPSDAGSYMAQVTWIGPAGEITASADYVIAAKPVTVTALPQTIEEGESISTDLSEVVLEGALPVHTLGSVVLTVSEDQIVPSRAAITDGPVDVSANYAVTYVPGELTVIIRPVYGEPDFVLPAAVQTIGESAFEGASMSVVYIPDSCTGIGSFAFKDCSSLSQIRVPAGCTISENAFDGCGNVFIFGTPGSSAEEYCAEYDYLTFAEE